MATDRHGSAVLRRLPLLAVLLSLCLIGVRTATAPPITATDTRAYAASAAGHLGVAARTVPDRLATAPLTKRLLPSGAALPAAALTVFLLAAGVVRRSAVVGLPQVRQLAAAGRGPPALS